MTAPARSPCKSGWEPGPAKISFPSQPAVFLSTCRLSGNKVLPSRDRKEADLTRDSVRSLTVAARLGLDAFPGLFHSAEGTGSAANYGKVAARRWEIPYNSDLGSCFPPVDDRH